MAKIFEDTSQVVPSGMLYNYVSKPVVLKNSNGDKIADAIVQRNESGNYFVNIGGNSYSVNQRGELEGFSGVKLYESSVAIQPEMSATSAITRSGVVSEELSDITPISSIDIIDQFALSVLPSLINQIPNVLDVNDSVILLTSRKAYKWASGLMQAASEIREPASIEQSENE